MAGIFKSKKRSEPTPATPAAVAEVKAEEAQERAAERAETQESTEMKALQERRRLLRRGGLRLLFSPARLEGPGARQTRKLGGGT